MTNVPQQSTSGGVWLNRLATEAMVLACITAGTMLLMNVQRHQRQVQQNWGIVIYPEGTAKADATRLAQSLVQHQVFDGQPRLVCYRREASEHHVGVVVVREAVTSPQIRRRLTQVMSDVCSDVFPRQPQVVELMDEHQNILDVLFTRIPAAGHDGQTTQQHRSSKAAKHSSAAKP